MPPATITRSPPTALFDRPGIPVRPSHAEHRARLGRADRLGHGSDGAHRLDERPARRAGDRDRDLADPEGVEHRELARRDRDRLAVHRLELERPRVVGLRLPGHDAERPRGHPPAGSSDGAAVAIDVQKTEPRPLQALDEHLRRIATSGRSRARGRPRTCRAGTRRRKPLPARPRPPARRTASGTAGRATTSRRRRPPRSSRSSPARAPGRTSTSATLPCRTK